MGSVFQLICASVTSPPSFVILPQGAQGPAGPPGPAGARGMPVSVFPSTKTYVPTFY